MIEHLVSSCNEVYSGMMASPSDQSICADMVRTHDRDRWWTAALAPKACRSGLMALYAFNLEIARIDALVSEPMIGLVRLQWWRDSIADAVAGKVRDHPVLRAMSRLFHGGLIGIADLDGYFDARTADFEAPAPKNIAAFDAYCRGTGGALCRMAVKSLGIAGPHTLAVAERIGGAYAMVGRLRNAAWAAGRGRVILPLDLLDSHGVSTDRLLAGMPGGGLVQVAAEISARAGCELEQARLERNAVPRNAVPALLVARVAGAQLRALEGAGFDLFSGNTEPLPLAAPLAVLRGAVAGRY